MGKKISRPNVIWIFGDQHRAQALSCNGDINAVTPNIDQLASMGCNFTNALSGTPVCMPFRGSLLSGRYPHKCIPGRRGQNNMRMPADMPTIADPFNEAGYHTAYFGKWHCFGSNEGAFDENGKRVRVGTTYINPEYRGHFKQWLGYENNNSQYDCYVHGHDDSGNEIPMYRLPGYETDELTDIFIDYLVGRAEVLNGNADEPFFAALSVQPPHDPYVAPAEFMGHFNKESLNLRPNVPDIPGMTDKAKRELAGYYAQIENLDWNIGRIVAELRRTGLIYNTHIMFFSDHGDMHGSHGQFRKMNPYEESIRIPFIISGTVFDYHAGRASYDAPVNHVDIPATTLGLCGIDKPDWMDGYDYSGCRRPERRQKDAPDSAFLQGATLTHPDSTDKEWRGIVTRDGWKYVAFESMEWLMFNLNDDPYEQMNLAHNTRYVDKKIELNARLQKWIDDTGDEFALPKTFVPNPFTRFIEEGSISI